MATTLATRKQSIAIRQRMQEIRTELPYDVDDARQRFKQLFDWKYHMSRHPLPILATAVAAGFLIVPRKRLADSANVHREVEATTPVRTERGLSGGIAGAVSMLLLRQAASLAANQIANSLRAGRTTST